MPEGEGEFLRIDDGEASSDDEMITEYFTSSDEESGSEFDSVASSEGSVCSYDSSEYTALSTIWEEATADLAFEDSQNSMLFGDSSPHLEDQESIRILFSEAQQHEQSDRESSNSSRDPPGRLSVDSYDDNESDEGDVSQSGHDSSRSKLELALEALPQQSAHELDSSVPRGSSHRKLQKCNSILSKTTCATYPLSDEEEEGSPVTSFVSSAEDDFSFGSSSLSEDASPLYAKRVLPLGVTDTAALMDTIDESREVIAHASINVRQSREALSHCFEKLDRSDLLLSPNRWKATLQTPPTSPQTHFVMCRRIQLEKFGGARRRKAYAKSKYMLTSALLKNRAAPGKLPVIPWMISKTDGSSVKTLSSLGGLERQRSFSRAKRKLETFFATRNVARRETSRFAAPKRSLSLSAIPSPPIWSPKKSSRHSRRVSLKDHQSTSERRLGLETSQRTKRSYEVPSERRLYLKHRLEVERYSGARRRRHFERTKRIMTTELVPILEKHKAIVESQKAKRREKRSRRSSRQRRSKERSVAFYRQKSYVESAKIFAQRDEPFVAWSPNGPQKKLTPRNIVSLQRQKSYKMTRDIFQRPEPFIAWSPKKCEEGHRSKQRVSGAERLSRIDLE